MTAYSVESEGKPRFIALGVTYNGTLLEAEECYALETMAGVYTLRDDRGNTFRAEVYLEAGAHAQVILGIVQES